MNRKYTRDAGIARHRSQKRTSPSHIVNLNAVRRIPRNRLSTGVVVWAHVPFEDDDGEKTRPAVVIDLRGRDVVLLPGTTSESRKRFGPRYAEVTNLSKAGLDRPTGIRQVPVVVDVIEIIEIVGALTADDAVRILGSRADLQSTGRLSEPTVDGSIDRAVA